MEMSWEQWGLILVHVAMGMGLAACTGLRAFLPLLVVGVAGRLEWVPLSDSYTWLASWPALVVFGAAVVAEILADKFPIVDHALDSLQTIVKPVAGGLIMATVVDDWAPLYVTVFWIITGGAVSGAVHVTKAKLRLVSSATTAGFGNPVLSAVEDVGALVGSVASIIVPWLVVIALVLALAMTWLAFQRFRRRPAT